MTVSHIALALLVNAIWGMTFIAAKIGIDAFGPYLFTTLRFALVLVVLLPWLKPVRGQFRAVLGVALTMGALHFALFYLGLSLAGNLSSVAIAVQLIVPFSVLIAVIFLGERIGWRQSSGIALAFAGVIVIGFDPEIFTQRTGLALVVAGALSAAVGLNLLRRLKGVPVYRLQAWIAVLSTPPMFVLTWAIEGLNRQAIVEVTWLGIGALAFTAVGATLIGHAAWYYLLQRYPVSTVSPFGLLAPIFGVMFGVTLLGDLVTPRLVIGGILTLTGVGIVVLRQAWRQKSASDG